MTSQRGVISYPIPLYQNLPIEAQFYKPSQFVIATIALGATTVVTTSVAHNYVIGQEVRLLIPRPFGTIQLNHMKAYVLSIPAPNQVELSIDSHLMDPFISTTYKTESPQIIAIGDINSGAINDDGRSPTKTFIPGSFRDISPR